MADKTAQAVGGAGTTLTFTACAAGGDTVPEGSTVIFRNTDAGTVTITQVTPGSVDSDLAVADRTKTVAQNEMVAFQPGRDYVDRETDPENPRVSYTYSGVTALTMAVIN